MHFKKSSATCFSLDQSKILLSGNGLNHLNGKLAFEDTIVYIFSHNDVHGNDHFLHLPFFSLSHNVFEPFTDKFSWFLQILSADAFNSDKP